MFKKILITVSISSVFVFTSCDQNEIKDNTPSPIAESMSTNLNINSSTDSLSKIANLLGIKKIVKESENNNVYSLEANSVNIGGDVLRLDKNVFEINVNNDIVSLKLQNKYIVKLNTITNFVTFSLDGNNYLNLQEMDNISVNLDKANVFAACVLINEFCNINITRYKLNNLQNRSWVTINVGRSRSSLEAALKLEVQEFLANNPDCTPVGGIDISCLWENHGCVGTQYYDCP